MTVNLLGARVNGTGLLLIKGTDQQGGTFRGLDGLDACQGICPKVFSNGLPWVDQLTFAERLVSMLVLAKVYIAATDFYLAVRQVLLMLHQVISLDKVFSRFYIHRSFIWNYNIASI